MNSLHFELISQARRDNLPPDNMLVGSFNDTIATIEGYHHTSEFNGSLEMFFALVEKCLPYRPVSTSCHGMVLYMNIICKIVTQKHTFERFSVFMFPIFQKSVWNSKMPYMLMDLICNDVKHIIFTQVPVL